MKTKFWDAKSQFPKRNPATSRLIGELARLEKVVLEIALSREELDAIKKVDLSSYPEGYRKARALFLIGAYTGLQHSDYKRISPQHVIIENGRERIAILAWKTKKFVEIPLHPNLKAILEACHYQAPKLSQQKLNDYIKVVSKLAGITEQRAVYPSADYLKRPVK